MILPFKPQFKPLICDGTKNTTFREDKHDRWKVGMKIHMATGVRTKNYKQFAEATVSKIDQVEIIYTLCPIRITRIGVNIKINGEYLTNDSGELDELIKNDGFKSRQEFFNWFNKDFKGKIIYWENLKIIE
jgi:hypothetical protein